MIKVMVLAFSLAGLAAVFLVLFIRKQRRVQFEEQSGLLSSEERAELRQLLALFWA